MCKVPHLAQVYNTHSLLSSGQATGLAHADIANLVTVSPINASSGVHKTSGNSGSSIGTPLVLGKALCLAQTSISVVVPILGLGMTASSFIYTNARQRTKRIFSNEDSDHLLIHM